MEFLVSPENFLKYQIEFGELYASLFLSIATCQFSYYFFGTYKIFSFFLGDSEHKPHVSSTPDIISLQLDGDEDFIILACDGLWDSVTYEDAARAVYNHILSCPGKTIFKYFLQGLEP